MATKPMRGPGGRAMHATERPKNTGKTMRRTMAFILKHYKWHCLAVVICIVLTVLAQLNGTLFLQKLYDSYLSPMLESGSTDFTPLLHKLIQVGAVYAIGVLCSWSYTRLMVNVSQGTMRNFREKLFGHMESLPISYFDTHSHGDIMSVYTNDIDTLRQFIGQSLPQLFSSIISIVSVFVSMIVLNVPLTLLTLVMVALMLFATKKIAGKSGKFFVRQQQDLGKVNGYIEEMMQGQKVVKVFNHEQAAIERFNELNEQLRDSSCRANSYAGQRPARQRQLCAVRRGGRGAGAAWLCRPDARHARGVHDAQPQLQPAHHAGQPAAELRRYGHGRCGARVPAAR